MDDKLIKTVLDNSFEEQFIEINLSKSGDIKFSGPGEIKVDGEGNLIFKIYCAGPAPIHEIFSSQRFVPGQLIDDSEYYSLCAKDFSGNLWNADRITKSINGGTEGYVVLGKINKLTLNKRLNRQVTHNSATIIYPGEIDFPCNTTNEVRHVIGGQERGWSGSRDIAQFNSNGFEFEIFKKSGYFILTFSSEERHISNDLIIQITETLSFIFAHSLAWTILEIFEGNEQILHIKYPLKIAEASKIQPPIALGHCNNFNSIWALFDKFLSHLITMPAESWDRFCYHTHTVIVAGLSTLEIEALNLSASIEGFLNLEFQNIASPSEAFREEIEILGEYLLLADLSQSLKNRLVGTFNAMLCPSAKDRLKELERRGFVDSNLIRAWDTIRHPFAHGDAPDYTDFQAFIDNRGAIIILFYHLIFLAIGYQGEYCDYSTRGYPIKTFNKIFSGT